MIGEDDARRDTASQGTASQGTASRGTASQDTARGPVRDLTGAQAVATAVRDNVATVLKGKNDVIELAVIAMLCEGHLLVDDVPGTGKTTLARALAASVQGSFARVQFTPDLLPADVTGTSIFDARTHDFTFRAGPVFANVVLADEINRASPKTQAALLEVMAERQVTTDGVAAAVPRPFLVLATQNPVDSDGTYPLPHAQLDRFALRISVGYPDPEAELDVLAGRRQSLESLTPVVTTSQVSEAIAQVRGVRASSELCSYVLDLVTGTRTHPDLRLGASPRGGLALLEAARARAACAGRGFATPEDVKAVAVPVLAHRLVLSTAAQVRQVSARSVVSELLATVETPTGRRLLGV